MSQGLTGSASVVPALDDIYGVTLSAPGDHEVLAYNNGTAEWINMTAAEADLAAAGHNHDAAYISVIAAPAANHFAYQTAGGELVDSTYDAADFAVDDHTHADATTDAHGFMTDDQFDKLAGIEAGATVAGADHSGVYIPVIASPADNHFPYQTAAGELDDSTYDAASFATAAHVHTEVFPFCMSGTLVTSTDTTAMRLQLPYAGTVVSACATVATAPTGATEITVDVHKNGSTLYTSHAKPHIAASGFTSGWHAPDEAECGFSADDYFTVNVDAVGSTVAGANLTVLLQLTRGA